MLCSYHVCLLFVHHTVTTFWRYRLFIRTYTYFLRLNVLRRMTFEFFDCKDVLHASLKTSAASEGQRFHAVENAR